MPSSYTNLRVHLVWATKHRVALIEEHFEEKLYQYMGGILRKQDHVLLAAGGTSDHVHLLVSQHPAQSVSDLVRNVKSNTSAWIHNTIPALKAFAWQTGFGAFSVSKSVEDAVREYIRKQKEHHQALTFQEEFHRLLERHAVEYDDRYLWD